MSELDLVLKALNTPACYLIYSLVVLYGVYNSIMKIADKFIKPISDKFIDNLSEHLASINTAINATNAELSKTRETLVALQHQQISLEGRVDKIEGKIK
nr:hypothetical protein GTC16762_33750 [Pigmentibacter ruber]